MFDIVLEAKTNRLPCSKPNVFAIRRLFWCKKLRVGVLVYLAAPTSKARKRTKSLESIAMHVGGTFVTSCAASMTITQSVTCDQRVADESPRVSRSTRSSRVRVRATAFFSARGAV